MTSSRHCPDIVAKQAQTGLWGIFEAKGGKFAKLGTAHYGKNNKLVHQMGGPWISHWLKNMINNPANKGTDDGKSLAAAYNQGTSMLAGLVKLVVIGNKYVKQPAELRFAFRAYDPPKGILMGDKPWPNVWYNPTDADY